jgi:hypothetical protein
VPKRGGSRGREKPSLRDLSRKMPSEPELAAIIDGLNDMEARGAALAIAALLDRLLEDAIAEVFVRLPEKRFNALFREPTAPLSSFSAKIALGHALSLYQEPLRVELDRIRAIRNAFAHSIAPLTFDEPLVAEQCAELAAMPGFEPSVDYASTGESPRDHFISVAMRVATHLLAIRYLRRSMTKPGHS